MLSIDGFLRLLDTRSFASLWYWITLATVWAVATRSVLGVPPDVIAQARRTPPPEEGVEAAPPPEALALLDWLSLTLPRRRVSPVEGAVLLALAMFGLTSLALLGFAYALEMAQALTLMLLPLAALALSRLGLARRMERLLDRARTGEVPAWIAAHTAARAMIRHRWLGSALSLVAVAIAAAWGTLWNVTHPNGF